ncbi:MAG: hotdog fold thioesterase [Bacteroidia bacterium]|nr:hotdog fold thioesterase [Bacteroidia bacterium]
MDSKKVALFEQILEEMVPFHRILQLRLEEISTGCARLRIPYRPDLVGDPRRNSIHGGVIASAMDAAGGAAALTTLTSYEDRCSTIDLRVDYYRPGRAEDIITEARIAQNGNRVIFTHIKAYHPSDPNSIIAEGTAVFSVRRTEPSNNIETPLVL